MASDAIIFLTYNVRAGTDIAAYRTFLRDVDSPFFNSQPGIVCYENWETREEALDVVRFSFFDIIYVGNVEIAAEIFTSPAIQDFSARWHLRWGIDPTPTPDTLAGNYQAAIYRRTGEQSHLSGSTAEIVLRSTPAGTFPDSSNTNRWVLFRRLVGQVPAYELDIYYTFTPRSSAEEREAIRFAGERLTTRP